MPWTYIVECKDGSYYVGSTVDLERRVSEHNLGLGAAYTRLIGGGEVSEPLLAVAIPHGARQKGGGEAHRSCSNGGHGVTGAVEVVRDFAAKEWMACVAAAAPASVSS